MPSAIELDVKRWVHVVPVEDESVTVTARGFACYYSNEPQPPEKASEGTELGSGSALTIENPSGRWFRAKEPSSTEVPVQPSILEVTAASGPEGEQISTAMIDNLAVTAGKLGANAVETAKIKNLAVTEGKLALEAVGTEKIKLGNVRPTSVFLSTTPAAGAEKSVTLGEPGVGKKITAVHVGDGAETKVKVKHSFETEAVNVVVQKGAETKKPGENYLNAAGAGNITWKPISLSEVEVTFGTAPIAKFESFVTVFA